MEKQGPFSSIKAMFYDEYENRVITVDDKLILRVHPLTLTPKETKSPLYFLCQPILLYTSKDQRQLQNLNNNPVHLYEEFIQKMAKMLLNYIKTRSPECIQELCQTAERVKSEIDIRIPHRHELKEILLELNKIIYQNPMDLSMDYNYITEEVSFAIKFDFNLKTTVTTHALNIDRTLLAYGDSDHRIKVYDLIENQQILNIAVGNSKKIECLVFSADSTVLAESNLLRSWLRVYSLANGQLLFSHVPPRFPFVLISRNQWKPLQRSFLYLGSE